jgi:hypothetical protein
MNKLSLTALSLLVLPAICAADFTYRAGIELGQQQFEREQRDMNQSRGSRILTAQDSTIKADLLPGLYAETAWRAHPSLEVYAAYRYAHTGDVSAAIDRAAFSDGTVLTGISQDVPELTLNTFTLGGRWTHAFSADWQASVEAMVNSQRLSCDFNLCSEQGNYNETSHRFETFGASLGVAYRITEQVSAQLKAGWESSEEYRITGYGFGLRYGF